MRTNCLGSEPARADPPEGVLKISPRFCWVFGNAFLYNTEKFKKKNSRPSVLLRKEKKSVHKTCTRCAILLHSQVSISSLHSHFPEARGGGGVRPAACIMPELFHATGSLNFHIHPYSSVGEKKGHSHCEQTRRAGEENLFPLLLHCEHPRAAFYCNNDPWMNARPPAPGPHPPLTPTNAEAKRRRVIFLTLIQDK